LAGTKRSSVVPKKKRPKASRLFFEFFLNLSYFLGNFAATYLARLDRYPKKLVLGRRGTRKTTGTVRAGKFFKILVSRVGR